MVSIGNRRNAVQTDKYSKVKACSVCAEGSEGPDIYSTVQYGIYVQYNKILNLQAQISLALTC